MSYYLFSQNLQFVILHELYHLYKRTQGKEFVELEEDECNLFALSWFAERKDLIGSLVAKYFILSLRLYSEGFLLCDFHAVVEMRAIFKNVAFIQRFIEEDPIFSVDMIRRENNSRKGLPKNTLMTSYSSLSDLPFLFSGLK